MNLDHTRKTYEELGRDDPFYAVLTVPAFRHNKWDVDEFYANGRREIAGAMQYLDGLGLNIARGAALDFGCGVGRLTQALAEHFENVTGVDIAESMVEKAREHNKHGDRVQYRANWVENLSIFPDASFDFIYCSITLQHIPPPANRRYVAEFMRLLRPDGIALFQVPNGKYYAPGSFAESWYLFKRTYVRRFWKRVRGKPAYEMHYIPRAEVERIIAEGGGKLIDSTHFGEGAPGANFRYCVKKVGR
jgi:ubiquinone/menaquinone biosynthesis C-methylase UbiE